MVSFIEFDPLEVAEIQAISAQIGGVGGRVQTAGTPSQAGISNIKQNNDARRKQQKQKQQEDKETELEQNLLRTGERITSSIAAGVKGALISALPPTAARVGFAAVEGFRTGGIAGGAAGVIGVAGGIILGEIARRNEEQQESIRRARGFESLGARKRRLRRATPGIFSLPGAIIEDPVKEAARIIETAQLFIQEHVKAPLSGVARRFEVAPGLEAAYDTIRLGLPLLNHFTDSPITSALGIEINFSAQDILPSIPGERFHRETDIAKWQSLPVNAHPVAATIMNEMRRRIDSQIAGTGVAGGWKVEPVFGD